MMAFYLHRIYNFNLSRTHCGRAAVLIAAPTPHLIVASTMRAATGLTLLTPSPVSPVMTTAITGHH